MSLQRRPVKQQISLLIPVKRQSRSEGERLKAGKGSKSPQRKKTLSPTFDGLQRMNKSLFVPRRPRSRMDSNVKSLYLKASRVLRPRLGARVEDYASRLVGGKGRGGKQGSDEESRTLKRASNLFRSSSSKTEESK